MKLKTNFKILLILAIILGAMLLLGTTKVQANSQENIEVELVDKSNTLIDNITAELYKYDETVDGENGNITVTLNFKNNTYTAKDFKEVQQYLKNNNLKTFSPKVYINIADNVKTVKDIKTNKEYNILNRNGKKYIEYNAEIAKIFNDFADVVSYYEINWTDRNTTLQYITEDNQITNYSITTAPSDPLGLYYDKKAGIEGEVVSFSSVIANEQGKYIIDRFKNNNGAYAVSLYTFDVRMGGGPDETLASAQTDINYINEYIYIDLPYNVGQNLTTKIKGTNNTIQFEYYSNDNGRNVYRAKITKDIENLIFNKAQTVILTYTTQNQDLDLPYTFEFPISVAGSTRTKLILNNDEDVKIDFNGVLPMGVTIKAEKIKDNTELYATLSTTGIESMARYYNQNSLTDLLLTDITTVGGNINGAIQLTFNVGEQYNGKYIYIAHKKHNGDYEYFRETVTGGSITIVVDELSPFIVAVEEKINVPTNQEPTDTTDKGEKDDTPTTNTISKEKDDTPKTGTETANIIGYVLATTILSGVGIIALKKNLK